MKKKINYSELASCAIKELQEMEACAAHGGVEGSLLELVKLKASQMRECDHCEQLHQMDAIESKEIRERMKTLKNWREHNHFTEREKAALGWTELFSYAPGQVDVDLLMEEVGEHFTEQELNSITLAVNVVNSWNNLSLGFRAIFGNENQSGTEPLT